MKKNQTKVSESTNFEAKSFRHDVDKLKREGIHSQKRIRSELYPSEELQEDLENISSNIDENSVSESSDTSPDKSGLRQRKDGKKNISDKFDEANEAQSEKNPNSSIRLVVTGIIVLAVVFICVVVYSPLSQGEPAEDGINIENLMKDLQSNYNTQSSLTFRIVKSAIKSAAKDSLSPGILVLLSTKKAKHVSKEFALHIASAISKSYISIEPNSLKSPEELKKDIDVTIERNLTENELKAVFVDGLDLLPFNAAMMFHSYCDHENAPFKKALYIMAVTSDEATLPSESKKLDVLASKRLNSVWQSSGDDQVSSLISRLTGNVAGITA